MGVIGEPPLQKGYASEDRPQMRVLWERDSYGTIGPIAEAGNTVSNNREVDYRRYYDPEFAKLEMEHIWKKSWLYAAREEDIPEIGDRVPFDVGTLSFMIVRSGPDEFKAFYNACLHRGTALCDKKESGESIKCPYHGWEWKTDGSLRRIPGHWDFPSVTKANASLPEVKLGRWAGFIFINAYPDCAPLEEALSVIPRHFKYYDFTKRYTAGRFRKLVPANWKIAQEAFQESYHLGTTHPAAIGFNGDQQTDYDLWAGPHHHIGRQVTPSGVPSMLAPATDTMYTGALTYLWSMTNWHYPNATPLELDPVADPRMQIANWHRQAYKDKYNRELDAPDTVILDSPLYFMFPHACFWMSETVPFTYAFTPHATNPELSYFEVRLMLPWPEGQPKPPAAELVEVPVDGDISVTNPEFSFLANVFMEDMANMPRIQKGIKAANPAQPHSILGRYQEGTIRHWNEVIDQKLGLKG